MYTSIRSKNLGIGLLLGGQPEGQTKLSEGLEFEKSPLKEALKKHFEAFDGLTEAQPIYKDKESENEHTKQ